MINPLAGRPLRYLIGADTIGLGDPGAVTVVPYDHEPVRNDWSVGYCNLLEETTKAGKYPPYLENTDTAEEYDERVIDPNGRGWIRNLSDQFDLRQRQGFQYIELDNADAYGIESVLRAIELAAYYGLRVIAKNPGLVMGAFKFVAHPNIYGMIIERDAGSPKGMHDLRIRAGKPDMPVWFVAFGTGRSWAKDIAKRARYYPNMGVTLSTVGEYGNARDILVPSPVVGVA